MKFSFLKISALLIGLSCILSSCGGSSYETKYVAVKTVGSELWSIMDVKTGTIVHQDEFKSCPSVIINDVFWVKNAEGKYDVFKVGDVTKPVNSESYKYISTFDKDGYAVAVKPGQAITIIDKNCSEIAALPQTIISADAFVNGYSLIKDSQDLYGFIDHKGNIVIEPKYERAGDFHDGIVIVGNKVSDNLINYFAIDTKGNELFKFSSGDYDNYGHFSEGFLPVTSDEQIYLLDKQGNKGIQVGKNDLFAFYRTVVKNGMIIYFDGTSYGIKNTKGEVMIRPKYDNLTVMKNGYFIAEKQDLFGIIDKDDKVVIPFEHKILYYINNERYLFGNDKNANIVDANGQDVGKCNIINLSDNDRFRVQSNYFNVDYALSKIMDVVGVDHIGRAKEGMKLDSFKDLVSGYKYLDSDKSHVEEKVNGLNFTYVFKRNLTHDTYHYVYGYRITDGKEYDYDNPIFAGLVSYSVQEYEPDAEVKLTEAIEGKLSSIGFNNCEDGIYKNDAGHSINVGYNNGVVNVSYIFADSSVKMDRNGRTSSTVEPDNYDYLGLDKKKKD